MHAVADIGIVFLVLVIPLSFLNVALVPIAIVSVVVALPFVPWSRRVEERGLRVREERRAVERASGSADST